MRLRRLIPLLVLCTSACHRGDIRMEAHVPGDLRIAAVAVYPTHFRWSEPAWRSFELTQHLIEQAISRDGDRALLFGPSEFTLYRAEDDHVFAASTLGTVAAAHGVPLRRLVVVRPWAEKRVHSSQQTLLDARGRPVGRVRNEETTFVGHLEVLRAVDGRHLLDLSGQVVVDPFAERPDDEVDPSPELTALLDKLLGDALDQLGDHLQPPSEPRDLPAQVAFNPLLAFKYQEPGRPAAERALAVDDPLDAELFRRARTRFANPGVPDGQLEALIHLPGGLYVLDAPAGAPLRRGDLITRIDGRPACPAAFQRARFRPAQLEVRRMNGDFQLLRLP